MASLPMASQPAHTPLLLDSRCAWGEAPAETPCLRDRGRMPRALSPVPPSLAPSRAAPLLRLPAPLSLQHRLRPLPQEQHRSPLSSSLGVGQMRRIASGIEAEAPLAWDAASAAPEAAGAGGCLSWPLGSGARIPAGEEGAMATFPVDTPGTPSSHLSALQTPHTLPHSPPSARALGAPSGAGLWWEPVVRPLGLAVCLGAAAVALALTVPSQAAARAKAESKGGKAGAVATQTSNATGDKGASMRNAAAAASFLEGLGVSTTTSMGPATDSASSRASSGAGVGARKKASSAEQEALEKQAAAVEMLEGFLKTHPDDVEALKMLLRVRLKAAQFPQGLQVLHSLMRLQPTEREWKYLNAQLLEYAGDLPGARQGFQELLSVEPLSARALQGLASVMRRSGEDSLVLGMVEEAVKKANNESKATELTNLKLLLAQLHALQGNVDAALAQYDEILAENPKDFRPYLCKGLVLSLAGEGEAADKLFKEFRQRCPKAYAPYLDNVIVRSSVEAQRQGIEEKAVKAQGTPTRPAVAMTQPRNAEFGK